MQDELLMRQMPHSLEAEQAVLGSMLIDANCVKDVMEKLQVQDFYLRQNREIFETIYSMFVYSRPIDAVTVADEMRKNEIFDELFDLRPKAIEERLKLRNPIYAETAAYGHMGRKPEVVTKSFRSRYEGDKNVTVELFTWEKLDYVDKVKEAFGL